MGAGPFLNKHLLLRRVTLLQGPAALEDEEKSQSCVPTHDFILDAI